VARRVGIFSRILVIDEATSGWLNPLTDHHNPTDTSRASQPQEHNDYRYCLIRIVTVCGYDRVCVMDAGKVAEIGTPLELFRKGGLFKSLCFGEQDQHRGGVTCRGSLMTNEDVNKCLPWA